MPSHTVYIVASNEKERLFYNSFSNKIHNNNNKTQTFFFSVLCFCIIYRRLCTERERGAKRKGILFYFQLNFSFRFVYSVHSFCLVRLHIDIDRNCDATNEILIWFCSFINLFIYFFFRFAKIWVFHISDLVMVLLTGWW